MDKAIPFVARNTTWAIVGRYGGQGLKNIGFTSAGNTLQGLAGVQSGTTRAGLSLVSDIVFGGVSAAIDPQGTGRALASTIIGYGGQVARGEANPITDMRNMVSGYVDGNIKAVNAAVARGDYFAAGEIGSEAVARPVMEVASIVVPASKLGLVRFSSAGAAVPTIIDLSADASRLTLSSPTIAGFENVTGTVRAFGAGEGVALRTNFNVYEVLSQQPISGTTRSAHRASANRAFYRELQANPDLARFFNSELGVDVMSHMTSGRGRSLLNPPNAIWHHPAETPDVIQLLRRTEHTNPNLQPILHPDGVGGFGNFYGN